MRKTAKDAEKTRLAILDAAARIFARDGFDAATLEAIGREANLTRGAIYWHFKDKQDLFEQIVGRDDELLHRLIAEALAGDTPPFGKLRRLLETVLDNFYDNEPFRQQIILTWYRLNAAQFPPVMTAKSAFVQNFLALMEDLLVKAKGEGELALDVDTRQAALHLSCLINGLYRLYHVAPDWARDKEGARRLFYDYLDSLSASSPAGEEPSASKENE